MTAKHEVHRAFGSCFSDIEDISSDVKVGDLTAEQLTSLRKVLCIGLGVSMALRVDKLGSTRISLRLGRKHHAAKDETISYVMDVCERMLNNKPLPEIDTIPTKQELKKRNKIICLTDKYTKSQR